MTRQHLMVARRCRNAATEHRDAGRVPAPMTHVPPA